MDDFGAAITKLDNFLGRKIDSDVGKLIPMSLESCLKTMQTV